MARSKVKTEAAKRLAEQVTNEHAALRATQARIAEDARLAAAAEDARLAAAAEDARLAVRVAELEREAEARAAASRAPAGLDELVAAAAGGNHMAAEVLVDVAPQVTIHLERLAGESCQALVGIPCVACGRPARKGLCELHQVDQ